MLCHKLAFHCECRYTECVVMLSVMYAECHQLAFMLSVVMPNVVKLRASMLKSYYAECHYAIRHDAE